MNTETRANLTNRTIWVRILYMIFFAIAYSVAEALLWLVALFQAIASLVTGSANEAVLRFGNNLSHYIYQIAQFVTFNDDRLAFPFADWPDAGKSQASKAGEPGVSADPGMSAGPAASAKNEPDRPM